MKQDRGVTRGYKAGDIRVGQSGIISAVQSSIH